MMEDDTHDLLIKAYLTYFKENEKFEARNSVRTHGSARRALRQLRMLAKERMDEIHTKHKGKSHNQVKLCRKAITTCMEWTFKGKKIKEIPKDVTSLEKTIRKKPFQLILFFLLYIEFFLLQSGTGYQ